MGSAAAGREGEHTKRRRTLVSTVWTMGCAMPGMISKALVTRPPDTSTPLLALQRKQWSRGEQSVGCGERQRARQWHSYVR